MIVFANSSRGMTLMSGLGGQWKEASDYASTWRGPGGLLYSISYLSIHRVLAIRATNENSRYEHICTDVEP